VSVTVEKKRTRTVQQGRKEREKKESVRSASLSSSMVMGKKGKSLGDRIPEKERKKKKKGKHSFRAYVSFLSREERVLGKKG